MSKIEHNGIYYDPNNEVVCDKKTLNNLIVENEHYKKQIADLEAKLAEAQKTIEIQRMSNDALKEENIDKAYDITDLALERAKDIAEDWEFGYQEEIKELKQQLAEKEKQTEMIKNLKVDELSNAITVIVNHLAETIKNLDDVTLLDIAQRFNQDKISFALEQIINLKLLILNSWSENDCNLFLGDIEEIIDNQIKQLKEGA